ncbi:MAG: uracil phosphoribosyltransferase [Fimbriimonadaceae bacterium]|nr:uracil phosphoribosyltransferase [Fimbriimonadaceae bacterium]
MALHVVDHPLAGHIVAQLRDKDTPPERYRQQTRLLTTILLLEATRDVSTEPITVKTPLENAEALRLGQSLAVVPVLRAGLAMLEACVSLFPDVAVGYIGLERHHETAVAHSYYCKLPRLQGRFTICLDPMLATGGSASQAISLLKANGAVRPVMVSIIAAPEGVEKLTQDHPDVPIFTAALDRELNDKKYILPGLGDFGDRLYGTL